MLPSRSRREHGISLKILVEKRLREEQTLLFNEIFHADTVFYEEDLYELKVDVCVSYGGDGTILYTANLFQRRTTPPILAI